jgi:uncharacterized protein YegP (UPF0339 family)
MSLANSRQTLFEWYDKYVGEAASKREVYGYWTFVLGYAVAILGVLIYLLGPGGRETFLLIREVAIAMAAAGLSLSLLGIAAQLPVRRQAVWAAVVGAAVSLLGVVYFTAVYPERWLGPGSPQRAVIAVYVSGVGVMAGVAVLVPVLTGERGLLLDRDLETDGRDILVGEAEHGGLFAVFRRGPADWRWRLLEQNAVADGVEGFASRPDVESTVEEVQSEVREAGILEIKHAAFRLYGDQGSWRWVLTEEDGSAVATSAGRFPDRDTAEESVSVFKQFGPGATLLDIQRAAFDIDRTGTNWTWQLLDDRREPLAVAPTELDSHEAVTAATDRLRESAGDADLLAIDHLGIEVRRESEGWTWRLLDSTDKTLARATTLDDAREAVRDRIDRVRERIAEAAVTVETEPGFELVAADGGDWEWRLVDDAHDVVATDDGSDDRDGARADVDDLRTHAADAGIVEGEDPAFELYRAADGWRWRLVDADRTVVERGTESYEDREAVEEAVGHAVEQTDVAELVEYEEAAFQLYEAESGDWRWRLVDEGGGVMTDSGDDFDSRDAAASGMSVIKEHAPDAELLEIESAAIELFRDDGEWGWRLVDEGGETLAACGSLSPSKADARDEASRMRELTAAAGVRTVGDGAFQVYERPGEERAPWRWRFLGADGRVVAAGVTGHTTRDGVERAVEGIRAAAPEAETHVVEAFELALAPDDGDWEWRLLDRDRELLAESTRSYGDRAAAEDAVAEVQAHAAAAEVFELRGPVYRVRERDRGWEWELVDAEWDAIAGAPATYEDRAAAEDAVAAVQELAPDAGLLDYEDAAYQLFIEDGDWYWRLVDEEGEERAVSAAAFDSQTAARESLDAVRGQVEGASTLEIETSSFELHEGESGWHWRLVDQQGDTVAESVRSYPTRTAAREGMQSLKDRAPDAGLVVAG